MFRSVVFFIEPERTAVKSFGFFDGFVRVQIKRESADTCSNITMFWTEVFFANRERPSQERLGLLPLRREAQSGGEVVET